MHAELPTTCAQLDCMHTSGASGSASFSATQHWALRSAIWRRYRRQACPAILARHPAQPRRSVPVAARRVHHDYLAPGASGHCQRAFAGNRPWTSAPRPACGAHPAAGLDMPNPPESPEAGPGRTTTAPSCPAEVIALPKRSGGASRSCPTPGGRELQAVCRKSEAATPEAVAGITGDKKRHLVRKA